MDRRITERIAAGYRATMRTGRSQYMCVIENLSPAGMCLSSHAGAFFRDCAPADIITVSIEAPSGEMLHHECSVRWSKKTLPRGARTLMGVEIINPSWEGTAFVL